jgi:hypothetical protein
MSSRIVNGIDAWRDLASRADRQWKGISHRFAESAFVVDRIEPKFALAPTDRFFCIGSCFARNIEEHLIYRGIDVLSMGVICPAHERPFRPNGFLNKYTTHAMLQEVAWVDDPPPLDERLFLETPQGWHDLQLVEGVAPAALERCIERRAYLGREYFSRLRASDVVLVTLGLNEVWYDASAHLFLNRAPHFWSVRREPERFQVFITSADENIDVLEDLYATLQSLSPGVRTIVTVSPVPMSGTFSGSDVAVANMLSKSTLRVAAESFANAHADVAYFPSYEMIANAPRALAYQADCLHVADASVEIVVRTFLETYLGGVERLCPDSFSEQAYLAANPDVEDAVRRAEIRSGFDHWYAFGRDEGRPTTVDSSPALLA